MFKNNKISILGSGWLGLPLAQGLQKEGASIALSTRSMDKYSLFQEESLNPYLIDIENDVEKNIENIRSFLDTNILIINITCKQLSAYQSLLSEIEKSAIKHVLFISSTSVYPSHQGLCKESDLIEVESNLRLIEKLFTESKIFDCSVIRFAGLIGPKRHPGRFFATGKSVKDANAKVNLIHLVDCLKLIETILDQGAWGEVFNGCADNHPTKQDYYSAMARSLGYPDPHCVVIENSTTKTICNEKIKTQLGYEFIYPDVYKIKW